MIDKATYAREFRKALSGSKIAKSDGSLNHKYFKEKIGCFWGPEDDELLIKAIGIFGIGKWDQMIHAYFCNRVIFNYKIQTDSELSLRTVKLLKLYDISEYEGRKLTKEEIIKEAKKNLLEGEIRGKMKYGIYYNI